MKVKELKPFLNVNSVNIFANNIDHFFENDGTSKNEYVFAYDDKINLWTVYGEKDIKEISCSDENIVIDV